MAYTNPKYMHEIIDLVVKAKSRKEKIEKLQTYDTVELKNLLKGTFDEGIKWKLPDGKPPYEPAEESAIPSNFKNQLSKLPYFVEGGKAPDMPNLKRETMFIRVLESIHPKDADLVLKMINKQQPGKGITKKLVQEAFPGLISK